MIVGDGVPTSRQRGSAALGDGFPRQCAHWLGMTGCRCVEPPVGDGVPSARQRRAGRRIPTPVCGLARNDMGGTSGTPSPTRGSTYRPVGRGPRAPPKNAYPAAGHMDPALQVHTPQKNNAASLAGGAVRQCRLLRRGGGRAEASAPRGCSSPPDAWPRPAPAGRAGRWRGR